MVPGYLKESEQKWSSLEYLCPFQKEGIYSRERDCLCDNEYLGSTVHTEVVVEPPHSGHSTGAADLHSEVTSLGSRPHNCEADCTSP